MASGKTPLQRAISLLIPVDDQHILRQWRQGETIRRIADDSNLPVKTVHDRLLRARKIAWSIFGEEALESADESQGANQGA